MRSRHPTVAIVLPFRNYERTLEAAIRSVLGQTYRALDLLLIDDGSTDASGEVARRYSPPARYLRRAHGGAGAARNTGVAHAESELIAFCDADDLWAESKLERQMAVFREDPGIDVVFGSVSEFWASGRPEGLRPAREGVPGALPSAMLIRRAAFERVGPFAEGWRIGEWAEWFTRMRAAGLREVWLSEVLVARGLHPSSSGMVQRDARIEYPRLLRAHLHRLKERRGG